MLTIHVASSDIGNLTWEPSLKVQTILLSLPEEAREFVIKELERFQRGFCLTLSGVVLSGPLAEVAAQQLGETLAAYSLVMAELMRANSEA